METNLFVKKYGNSKLRVCEIRDLQSICDKDKKVVQVFVLNANWYLVEYLEDK